MELNAYKEVIQFAIGKEKEAVEFYTKCSEMTQRSGMKSAFLEMADEEQNHVRMLENFKPELVDKLVIKEVRDLKISDYLVDLEFAPGMKYQDLLILAMKREEAAAKMYQDLAGQGNDPSIEKLFNFLAQEEMKHKNRLETEYDETVLKQN